MIRNLTVTSNGAGGMVAVGNGLRLWLPSAPGLAEWFGGSRLGDHLTVDVALIRATAGGLGLIRDALQRADAANPGAEVLGRGGLAEAMDEFAHNWDIHRGKLISVVEAHQKMAAASADAYEHTDNELAKGLTQHSASAQHSAPGEARAAS